MVSIRNRHRQQPGDNHTTTTTTENWSAWPALDLCCLSCPGSPRRCRCPHPPAPDMAHHSARIGSFVGQGLPCGPLSSFSPPLLAACWAAWDRTITPSRAVPVHTKMTEHLDVDLNRQSYRRPCHGSGLASRPWPRSTTFRRGGLAVSECGMLRDGSSSGQMRRNNERYARVCSHGKFTLSGHVSGLGAGPHCVVRELLRLTVRELHRNYGLYGIDISEP